MVDPGEVDVAAAGHDRAQVAQPPPQGDAPGRVVDGILHESSPMEPGDDGSRPQRGAEQEWNSDPSAVRRPPLQSLTVRRESGHLAHRPEPSHHARRRPDRRVRPRQLRRPDLPARGRPRARAAPRRRRTRALRPRGVDGDSVRARVPNLGPRPVEPRAGRGRCPPGHPRAVRRRRVRPRRRRHLRPFYGIDPADAAELRMDRWFIEVLGAAEATCPVVWHAPGVPADLDDGDAERVRAAVAGRAVVAVRDELSRARLEAAGVEREIAVVPDSALLLPRVLTPATLAGHRERLRADDRYPADGPVVVVQGNHTMTRVRRPARRSPHRQGARRPGGARVGQPVPRGRAVRRRGRRGTPGPRLARARRLSARGGRGGDRRRGLLPRSVAARGDHRPRVRAAARDLRPLRAPEARGVRGPRRHAGLDRPRSRVGRGRRGSPARRWPRRTGPRRRGPHRRPLRPGRRAVRGTALGPSRPADLGRHGGVPPPLAPPGAPPGESRPDRPRPGPPAPRRRAHPRRPAGHPRQRAHRRASQRAEVVGNQAELVRLRVENRDLRGALAHLEGLRNGRSRPASSWSRASAPRSPPSSTGARASRIYRLTRRPAALGREPAATATGDPAAGLAAGPHAVAVAGEHPVDEVAELPGRHRRRSDGPLGRRGRHPRARGLVTDEHHGQRASPSSVRKWNPSMPWRTVSSWPASPITTGTAPADIASTVVIPKCSRRSGCALGVLAQAGGVPVDATPRRRGPRARRRSRRRGARPGSPRRRARTLSR